MPTGLTIWKQTIRLRESDIPGRGSHQEEEVGCSYESEYAAAAATTPKRGTKGRGLEPEPEPGHVSGLRGVPTSISKQSRWHFKR
jgi:hypothetical protein